MPGIGTSGFGPGSSSRFTGFRHGNLDGRNNSFRYPSPWWDVAHMDMPRSVKHLFRWCRYHMLVNPLVSSVTRKMAAYPLTDVIIDDEPEEGFDKHKEKWEDCLLRVLNISRFQLEVGLDYYGYGNCIVSILYPFHKSLQCRQCNYKKRIKRLKYKKEWNFKNFKYVMNCPKCSHSGYAKVSDDWYKSYKDLKLIRWNPSDINIDFNPITREPTYAYNAGEKIRTKVLRKNRRYLEELPHALIRSMASRRPFIIHRDNVFHFKSPTPSLSENDEGWGYPPILPALKDSFYLQIMKKAQEAIMLEHLVPLDVLFPASADANANPYLTINLSDWKRRIEQEIVKWRWDPNHKPILPVPIGHQRIGGNGRALMLTQEIRAWSEHIIAGMGVPQEFVFGGLSWSGSNVSLRMLENQLITYRTMHEHFLKHFLIPHVARYMEWKEVSVHLKAFKMADDMQAKQLLLSLNQLQKLSDKTLLAEFDKDALDELKLVEQELRRRLEVQKLQQLYQAQMDGEAQKVQTKYQIESQDAMARAQMKLQQEQMAGQQQQQMAMQQQQQAAAQQQVAAQQPQPRRVNVIELAEAYAKKLSAMDPTASTAAMQQMQQQMPELHQLVAQKLAVRQALEQRPLPEQRPPRREMAQI
jgi:hypothetical protein